MQCRSKGLCFKRVKSWNCAWGSFYMRSQLLNSALFWADKLWPIERNVARHDSFNNFTPQFGFAVLLEKSICEMGILNCAVCFIEWFILELDQTMPRHQLILWSCGTNFLPCILGFAWRASIFHIQDSMLQKCSRSVKPQNESPFWRTEREITLDSGQNDASTIEYGSKRSTGHQPCFVPLLCFAQCFDDLDEGCFVQPKCVPSSHDQQVTHVRGHSAESLSLT